MQFQKATRRKAKLRLGIAGPSGSGKTLGALMIAKGIGGRIAVIDTERDSASLYAEPMRLADQTVFTPPPFDTLNLEPPYTPERFIEAIRSAEAYDILIIDSTTAEWSGMGGCLELVDSISKAKFGGNSYMAWSAITPRHRAFLDAMLRCPMHIIATMRSKTETAQVEDGGKKKVVKLGMKTEQRDGVEYEFTTVLDIIHDGHFATASKDRTGLFAGDPQRISEDTGRRLLEWLESGAEMVQSAYDLAAAKLQEADTSAETFKAAWEANRGPWKDILTHDDYQRLIARMLSLAAKWAPSPKEADKPKLEAVA
jgi:hypothetical protein